MASIQDENDAASDAYPSIALRGESHCVHVYKAADGAWDVWLNTEVADFDGLCLGSGPTRQVAVSRAVQVLEAATELLQGPPWAGQS